MNPRILLVGEYEPMHESARALFALDSYIISLETDGYRSIERQWQEQFDVIVVDLELSPFDQGETLAFLREARPEICILVLTSQTDANDAIAALEVGADDYLKKPFDTAELAARVRALLRRASWMPRPDDGKGLITVDDLTIDNASFLVWKSGQELSLSVTEFNLLLALIRNPERTLTRQELLAKAWPYQFLGNSRLVDMTIARLRSKIEDNPKHPRLIHTVRGVGYRFEPRRSLVDS